MYFDIVSVGGKVCFVVQVGCAQIQVQVEL